MNLTSNIQKLLINTDVKITDPIFEKIDAIQEKNNEELAKLNNCRTKEEIRQQLSKVINDTVDPSVTVMLPFYTDFGQHIKLGKDVFINRNAMFVDLGGITLDDHVLIGPRANLITVNHLIDPAERRGLHVEPIHLKENAWVGAAATILPGVTIGKNSIVAAGATVTKDVPDNVIVAGIPAKIVKEIVPDSEK